MWYDKPLSEVARAATPRRDCPEEVASKPDSTDKGKELGGGSRDSRAGFQAEEAT